MTRDAIEVLPVQYFERNRQRLLDQLEQGSVAVLVSGAAPHKSADEDYPFWANRNFYYLSGVEQEQLVLILIRDGQKNQSILFIQEPDPMHDRWREPLLTVDEAKKMTGITDVRYLGDYKRNLLQLLGDSNRILWMDQQASGLQINTLRQWLAETVSVDLSQIRDLNPILTRLRMIKDESEIQLIQHAIGLTHAGIRAMLQRLRPGLMEYHLWAEFAHVLAEAGCLEPAFPTIVASGENLFCLHHMHPFGEIKAGDLVQIDVGARVGGLCADISRVFPASGRFSERERALYAIVRQCQETAFATICPEITLADINEACRKTAKEGLLKAEMMERDEPVTKYFWHNVSHHMGLDVHDVFDREAKLQPGMVLTVEPGIYIPELGIGMRIEDDVVITEDGCSLLSIDIPREAEEIEALMR